MAERQFQFSIVVDDRGTPHVKEFGEVAEQAFKKVEESAKSAATQLDKLGSSGPEGGVISFSQRIAAAGSRLEAFGKRASEIGKAASMSFSASIGAFGMTAFRAASNIDEAFDQIKSRTGKTGEDFEKLATIFRNVAGQMPASFDQVAVSISTLTARFGLEGAALEQAAKQSLNYARVNRVEVSDAITGVYRIMSLLGMKASELPSVYDKFTAASQRSGVSVQTMSGLLEGSASILSEMGFNFNEMIGIITSFEKAGSSASMGIWALRYAFLSLSQKGVPDVRKAFDDYITRIKNAKSVTEATSIAGQIFGRNAAKMAVDIRSGALAFDKLAAAVEGSAGSVEKTSKATMSFSEVFQVYKNQISLALEPLGRAMREFAEKVLPMVGSAIKTVGNIFQALPEPVRMSTMGLLGFLGILGPVLMLVGKYAEAVGGAIKSMKSMADMVRNLNKPLSETHSMLGKVGAAGMAAFIGWNVGRVLGDLLGLNEWVEKGADKLISKLKIIKTAGIGTEAGHVEAYAKQQEAMAVALELTGTKTYSVVQAIRVLEPVYKKMGTTGSAVVDALIKAHLEAEVAALKNAAAVDEAKKAVGIFSEEVKKLAASMGFMTAGNVQKAVMDLGDSIRYMKSVAGENPKLFEAMSSAVSEHYKKLKPLADAYGIQIPSSIKKMAEQVEVGKAKIEAQKKADEEWKKAVDEMSKSLEELTAKSKTNGSVLDEILGPSLGRIIGKTATATVTLDSFGEAAALLGVKTKDVAEKDLGVMEQAFFKLINAQKLSKEETKKAAEGLVAAYTVAGREVPEWLRKMSGESTKASEVLVKTWTTALSVIEGVLMSLSDSLEANFKAMAQGAITAINSILTSLKSGRTGFADLASAASAGVGIMAGGIGGAISGKKTNYGGTGAALGGAVGSIFGPLGGLVGSFAGGILGGLFGKGESAEERKARLEKAHFDAQVREARDSLAGFGRISDETANKIFELRKRMSGAAAEALVFGDVIADVGVSQANLNKLWEGAHGVINNYVGGQIKAKEAGEALGGQFSQLIAGAQKFGEEGSAAMEQFIFDIRESGLEVQEVTDYLNTMLGVTKKTQMSAAEGLMAMVEGIAPGAQTLIDTNTELQEQYDSLNEKIPDMEEGIAELTEQLIEADEGSKAYKNIQKRIAEANAELVKAKATLTDYKAQIDSNTKSLGDMATVSQDSLDRVGRQVVSVFSAMILNGASYAEAMEAISPALDALIEKHKQLGTEASGGIKELLKIREVTASHKELMAAIEGNLAVLDALAVSGSLDQQALDDAAKSADDYYKQLVEAGLSGNQALAQMAPTLSRLRYLAKEHELSIDDATQALIDQAEKSGILGKEQASQVDVLKRGFETLVATIGALPEAIVEAFQKMMDGMTNIQTVMDKTGTSIADAAEVGSEAWGKMVDQIGDVASAAGELEHAIYGSGIGGALEKIEAKSPDVFGGMIDDMREAASAAGGLQGGLDVPGAYVDRDIVGETKKNQDRMEELLQELIVEVRRSGQTEINPVVIPKEFAYIIEFVKTQIEKGNWTIPASSVR